MTAKNPSDTWFFNDWENDEKLKVCSLAAQGLWKRLLCIAARSPERGVVQIGSLNCSRTEGLTHIASAVGHPPQEIAPLIDELVSSGAAYVDRKGRIFNRRMVDAGKVSAARAKAGEIGAAVTNGKRWGKVVLGHQNVDKPSSSSRLQSPNPLLISSGSTLAASASASPHGPPRSPLPDTGKWIERLAGYRPWEGKAIWQPFWGPRPDSMQKPSMIPPGMHRAWLEEYEAAKRRGEAA